MLVPPRNGRRSTRRTLAPVRAAAIAAVEPAEPDPIDTDIDLGDQGQVRHRGRHVRVTSLARRHGRDRPAAVDLEKLAGHDA